MQQVKSWMEQATSVVLMDTSTPMPEPRRSPRLSTGGKAAPGLTPATAGKENSAPRQRASSRSPNRRSSLLKRGLEPRASPAPAAVEDELPEEMQDLPSDSPAHKKSRPSEARRMSRVSFGGVELRKYDKNAKGVTPSRATPKKSPAPAEPAQQVAAEEDLTDEVPDHHPTEVSTVTEVSEVSEVSSNEEGFFSPGRSPGKSPGKGYDADVTEPIPSLKDLADDLASPTATNTNLTAALNLSEETVPVPRLSELGDFDDTASIQPRASSTGPLRDSLAADNTAVIAAHMNSRPSMAPHAMGLADTPTNTGPSLHNLVKRAQGELDDSTATGSIQATSSADLSEEDDMDGSMEMTECYGGIVQAAASGAQSSPARAPVGLSPSLAAASMTTLNVKPPESPNLKKLLRERAAERDTTEDAAPASPAPVQDRRQSSIGSMIPAKMDVSPIASSAPKPKMSTTPQAMMRRKGASMLAATADIAPPSPVADVAPPPVASPALMRAGSRITMTASGASPSPAKPPRSPCMPSPMKVSPAQAARSSPIASMPTFDAVDDDASKSNLAMTADQHADAVLGNFEGEEDEEESLHMPDSIPDVPIASPSQPAAAQTSRQSSMGGANLKRELKRRSVAPAGRASLVPIPQIPDSTRTSTPGVKCDTMKQFMAIADINFMEDMTVNRRDTLCIRPGATQSQNYNLGEAIAMSTTALPELRTTQEACDNLTNMITTSQGVIDEAEKATQVHPPALFTELASDTRSEAATVIRGKLKTLKQTSRKEAKLEWYTWYKTVIDQVGMEAQAEEERLTKEESDLATRCSQYDDREQKLRTYMEDLGVQPLAGRQLVRTHSEFDEADALEQATAERQKDALKLQEQVAKLAADCAALQNRKDALELSVEGLNSQKGYLMGNAEGAATVSVEDADRAQQRYLAQLDIEGVVLHTIKYNEIVADLCESHRIILTMEGGNVAEAQLKLFEANGGATSFGEVDDFWRGLGACARLTA